MATDDQGGDPTDLSGVTFIGGPRSTRQNYHIRRNTGKVLGPFDQELVVQMIRGRKLTGDEDVSEDRERWLPIKSVSAFSAAFAASSAAGPAVSGAPVTEGARTIAGSPLRLSDLPDLPTIGSAVVPLDDDLGDDATQVGATGAWASIEDEEDLSVARAPEPALSGVSGVRKITTAAPPTRTAAELPMPAGFTNFPLGDDVAPSFPGAAPAPPPTGGGVGSGPPSLSSLAPPSLASIATRSMSPTGSTLSERVGPGTLEIPKDAVGGTIELRGAPTSTPRRTVAFGEMESSAGGEPPVAPYGAAELPISASGGAELPVSARSGFNLPSSLHGEAELPASAYGNLPASARGNLPVSAGQLPAPSHSLWDLPASSTDLPRATAGGSQFGTMAMSGLSADLPRSAAGPNPLSAPPVSPDLPASARASGPSVLDSMAQTDDIWAAPESPIRASADELRASSQFGVARSPRTEAISIGAPTQSSPLSRPSHDPFATEPIAQPTWSDRRPGAGSTAAPLADPDEFGEFFPAHEPPTPAAPAAVDELPIEPHEEPPSVERPRKKGRGREWGMRIGLLAVLLVVLLGAALILRSLTQRDDEEVVVAPPTDARPVVVIEVPPVEAMNPGGYRALVEYVDTARTAVGDRGSESDRASFLVASSLMLIEYPEHDELFEEMARVYAGLPASPEPESAELVALARAAYLAATADEAAPLVLEAARSGRWAGLGHLLSGLYEVQKFRGVRFEVPAPEPVPAEGSGGSGDGSSAEGSAADPEAPAADAPAEAPGPEPTEIAAPEEPDEDDAAPTAAPAPAAQRVLSPDAKSHFERAAAAVPELVAARYWRGWVALDEDDTTKALEEFEAAIAINPEHVAAELGVARALRRAGRLRDADTRIQHVIDDLEAVSSKGERADTFIVAAEISIARLQPVIAIESLLSALQADPASATALRLVAEQFFRSQEYTRALDYFHNAADSAQPCEVALGKAMAQFGLEAYADARGALEAGATRCPSDARFPYWLGLVYETEAEFDLSRQYYRQALQLDPTDVRPLARLALLAVRERKPAEALRLLDDAVAIQSQDAAMWNTIGEMYLQLGETNRAVSAFREALRLDQSEPDAKMNLTQYYLDSEQQWRATELLTSMIDAGVDSPRVRYLNARALLGQEQYVRAVEELLALQEAEPRNADYLFLMGRVHFEAGNYLPARAQFVRALEEAPTLEGAQYYIGRCDVALGQFNEAITSLTAVSHRSPRGEYHYWLGVALEAADQAGAALAEYETTVNGDVAWALENPDVYTRRGRLYYVRGALEAAYQDLKTVLFLRPSSGDASYLLGRVHYDDRRYEEAIAALSHAIEVDPTVPRPYYFAGLAHLRFSPPRLSEALPMLEKAHELGLASEEPELLQKLAYVYRDLGRRGEAADALEEFLRTTRLPEDEEREMRNEILTLRGQR